MAAILTFLVGLAGRLITSRLLYYGALKLFLFSLFTVVVPTIILTFIQKFLTYTLSYASSHVSSSGLDSLSLELVGMGGYLASETGLPACFALIISAVALRATLNLISPRL
jgi:hypothetical protein